MSDLCSLTLVDVASAIKDKRVSAVEVMQATLARAERLQTTLNLFITLEAEDALASAVKADQQLARNPASCGPLHGLPVAHKDIIYRAGKVCTCGSKIRRDFRPEYSATVVQRLEAAGAIHVGGLHTEEFASGGMGHNDHYGPCRNPWNTDYTPGGSSSGSGAAVAARVLHGSLGSDTGGSVRLPAEKNGVVGLKSSFGRVSRHGIMPRSWATDTIGPLTRTARDCARMTRVIAGYDPMDSYTTDIDVPDFEADLETGIKGLRLGVPTNYYYDNVADEVHTVVRASLAVFRDLGVEIVELETPDPEPAFNLAQILLRSEAAAVHEEWLRERPEDYSSYVRGELLNGLLIPAVRYLEAQRFRKPMLAEFCEKVFSKVDVLHTPVSEFPPPLLDDVHPHSLERASELMLSLARLTRPIGYIGLPALAMPCGFVQPGLPTAFQLVGRPYAEGLLLRFGHAYQRETDWHEHVPPL